VGVTEPLRVVMWAGRTGAGLASAGARIDGHADVERVRRAVLACGVALAADRLASSGPGARDVVVAAFSALRPEDIVDLTGRCVIGGLTVPPGVADLPPPGAAVADLLLEPGDDPDDSEPRVHPGVIEPAEAAALSAAALARAMPRDPLHLARTGVALRSIAREANLYPATLPSMAPGIAATARNPEDVRLFSGPGPEQGHMPGSHWTPPDAMTVGIGLAAAVVAGVIGVGIAALAVSLIDPVTTNSTTALVAGGIIGALIGAVIALRLLRRAG
jgi:hypothetical protein